MGNEILYEPGLSKAVEKQLNSVWEKDSQAVKLSFPVNKP